MAIFAYCIASVLIGQNTYTFTNAGATLRFGPTQTQINTAYASTNLNNSVVVNPQGVQNFTIPYTGLYRIDALGAQGGNGGSTTVPSLGGKGARIVGEFNLNAGTVLSIIVGQQGESKMAYVAGGGGGSFVWIATQTLNPLVAAGGGGGGGGQNGTINSMHNGIDGVTGQNGTNGNTATGGAGTSGNGGVAVPSSNYGAGGGGWLSDGVNGLGSCSSAGGGLTPLNGGIGGIFGGNSTNVGVGGFGGGGGAQGQCNATGGGGGGGYSGGGGGIPGTAPFTGGGGGGSYNGGTNQNNTSGFNSGNGLVVITQLYSVMISQTASISCNGNSNAALSSTVTGGQAPYTYTWLPTGGNTTTASGLSAGVYTLVVKDFNNQLTSATYTVSQPAIVTASLINQVNATCYGNTNGSATITANGGTFPYTYTWSPTGGSTAIASGLGAGVYTCVVKDNNNCPTGSVTLAITQPAAITGTASSLSVCIGNSVTLTGTGATSYTWSGGINNGVAFTPTATTAYTVVGTNSVTSCAGSAVLTITVNPTPTISVSNVTVCSGSSATLSPSGASTYSYSGGSSIVSPSATTVYTINGASAAGCQANAVTVTVIVSPCTGINEISDENNSLLVYPNPNNGSFIVDAGNFKITSIKISDAAGKLIKTMVINDFKHTIDINTLSNGVYFIKTETEIGIKNIKIIKQ